MRKIRIYKDLKIKWKVMTNKEAEPLEGRDLTFEIVNKFGRAVFPFVSEGNVLSATFPGTEQKQLGDYWVTLWENKGKAGQTLVDSCCGFTLVSDTAMEDDDDNTLNGTAELTLCSNLYVGIQGESAYEIWLRNGFEGTEADFIEWLRKPAVDASNEAATAEAARKQAESNRVLAEQVRAKAESSRVAAEKGRVSAESSRKDAEFARVNAEAGRVTEFGKLKKESETATKNAQDAADIAAVNILAIEVNAESGVITAYTGGENTAFTSGGVNQETGNIELNFNYN